MRRSASYARAVGEPSSRGVAVSWLAGGMAERTIALVLKTSGLHGPGGSNPSAPTGVMCQDIGTL